MKKIVSLFIVIALMVLWGSPVLAAGLSLSPPTVEFDVLANGSTEVEFLVYDFTGNLEISLEDIPLRVEPTTVSVTADEGGAGVVLTFYGDSSLGTQIFEGKIRFLAMTGGTVAMGIKVRATVNHLSPRESPVDEASEEDEASEDIVWTDKLLPYDLDPIPIPESKPFPIIPVAGIVAATIIIVTLIVVIAKRYQY